MCITYPRGHNLSRYAQAEGMAGNVGTGQAPRATCEESAGGAAAWPGNAHHTRHQCGGRRGACRAWPGFEPTRRAKRVARTASGPDGARNTGGAASNNTGGAASNNTGEAATASSIEDSGPAPS